MLIDLAIRPEWREKCKKEIRDLLFHHLDESPSSETLHERISMPRTPIRRNHYEEAKIGEQVIRQGDFLLYPITDVHLNPEYYPEPYKYDPGRWLRPDPVPNTIYPFIGWGAGRHPCAGMKIAGLEMKLILVLCLVRYEFELVNKDGKFPNLLSI